MTTNRLAKLSTVSLRGTGILVTSKPARPRGVVAALRCALRGLRDAWASQPNLRIHASFGGCLLALGVWCRLAVTDWLWVSFAIGLVIFAELMNTAIEETVDLVVGLRPDPLARRIKDISAGCVLVAALLAIVIQSLTFVPHLVSAFVH